VRLSTPHDDPAWLDFPLAQLMTALVIQLAKRPRTFGVALSFLLVAFIGVIDYLAGYGVFFSAFYLVPVALASWYVGRGFGLGISIACVTVSVAGDYLAGASYPNVLIPIWNGAIESTVYFVVVMILTSLRKLHAELEERVRQRTNALTSEMLERARLEKELLEVSEREQRRIGHDLHDGVCQHWAATAIAGQVLGEKLAAKALPEAVDAREIVRLVQDGITLTRNVAHGIAPPEMEAEGLVTALEQLAANVSKMFRVDCLFECQTPPPIEAAETATHLYRIAQEAVNNAIHHGKPRQIVISLGTRKGTVELTVEDDGAGLPDDWQKHRGLGTRSMAHRAAMINGTFSIEPNPTGGTFVKCTVSTSGR
jgi:signal transduction histidine kinase